MPEISPVVMIVGTLTTPQVATLDGALTKHDKHLPLHNAFVTMKRSISNIDAAQQSRCASSSSTRRKTQHVDPPRHVAHLRPFRTHHAIQPQRHSCHMQRYSPLHPRRKRSSSTAAGDETCPADSDPDMMAAPPTTRSAGDRTQSATYTKSRVVGGRDWYNGTPDAAGEPCQKVPEPVASERKKLFARRRLESQSV
jgi:hypothetical protein